MIGGLVQSFLSGGEPAPAAMQLLDRLGCGYIELSPSGTGLRGFGYAEGEPIAGTRGQLEGVNVELYASKHYLTVTGRPLISGPIVQLQGFAALADLVRGSHLQYRRELKKTDAILCPLPYIFCPLL